ncbi:hypothetical protein CC80DRAFT_311001 [Byssothecium circinans]|uniref:Secreted protein n=1 Tax=Byssothecium circinans TaxID=147558 RepID=A0A6A5U3V0_9PLEO|nr:hypothetical protein CC80DRAFT_311001 [Byssothecium circinans]
MQRSNSGFLLFHCSILLHWALMEVKQSNHNADNPRRSYRMVGGGYYFWWLATLTLSASSCSSLLHQPWPPDPVHHDHSSGTVCWPCARGTDVCDEQFDGPMQPIRPSILSAYVQRDSARPTTLLCLAFASDGENHGRILL